MVSVKSIWGACALEAFREQRQSGVPGVQSHVSLMPVAISHSARSQSTVAYCFLRTQLLARFFHFPGDFVNCLIFFTKLFTSYTVQNGLCVCNYESRQTYQSCTAFVAVIHFFSPRFQARFVRLQNVCVLPQQHK